MSFDKSILVYSSHCPYSMRFLDTLTKNHPLIYDSIIRMNIDVDLETKKRPKIFYQVQNVIGKNIEKVPSLILTNGRILVDDAIDTWLDFISVQPEHKTTSTKKEPERQQQQIPSSWNEDDTFGNFQPNANTLGVAKQSEKKQDMDNRLQDMINERNQIDEQFKQKR
jgi:hypothetical protein